MWCYECSWDVRGDLPWNSMAQIHTSVTLLTSRDLTCQHASRISVVAHISWDGRDLRVECSSDVVIGCLQKNTLFMSVATLKATRLECYLHLLPGAESSHEITWHEDMRVCRLTWRELTWREDSVSPALISCIFVQGTYTIALILGEWSRSFALSWSLIDNQIAIFLIAPLLLFWVQRGML